MSPGLDASVEGAEARRLHLWPAVEGSAITFLRLLLLTEITIY